MRELREVVVSVGLSLALIAATYYIFASELNNLVAQAFANLPR